jgi:hypothetical protein
VELWSGRGYVFLFCFLCPICGEYRRDGAYFSATRIDLLVILHLKINNMYIYIYEIGVFYYFFFFKGVTFPYFSICKCIDQLSV